jgi:hypothetical protein
MVSNEERIARLEGINEEIRRELGGIHTQLEGLRTEARDIRSDFSNEQRDLRTEIRSTRNTLLMVNLLLWVATIGTMVGFFVTQ